MYQEDGDPAAALVARIGQEPKSAFFGGLRRQPNPTEGGAQTSLWVDWAGGVAGALWPARLLAQETTPG